MAKRMYELLFKELLSIDLSKSKKEYFLVRD